MKVYAFPVDHYPAAPDFLDRLFIDGVKESYSGPVIMGEDGMFFTLDPKN